jgi:hypothetical protein
VKKTPQKPNVLTMNHAAAGATLACLALTQLAGCAGDASSPELGEVTSALRVERPVIAESKLEGRLPSIERVGPLLPEVAPAVPFTPAPPTSPLPNATPRFTFATLGDSYGAGEGAPEMKGSHEAFGTRVGQREFWGTGLPQGLSEDELEVYIDATRGLESERDFKTRLAREARACHRSDSAGYEHARRELAEDFGIQVVAQSFACSGAEVPELIDHADVGHAGCTTGDGLTPAQVVACVAGTDALAEREAAQPQLAQLARAERGLGKVDAVYMSIGGNDMGFGDVITDCLLGAALEVITTEVGLRAFWPPALLTEALTDYCADVGSDAQQQLADGDRDLPGNYARLAAALERHGIPSERTLISTYPDPLTNANGGDCTQADFTLHGDPWFGAVAGDFNSGNIAWLRDDAIPFINSKVEDAAREHGFRLVNVYNDGAWRHHGMCVERQAQFFNDLFAAQAVQGADLFMAGLPQVLSTGAAHPNVDGHREVYGPSIARGLAPLVREKLVPKAAQGLRIGKVQPTGTNSARVEVWWADADRHETSYRVEVVTHGRSQGEVQLAANTLRHELHVTRGTPTELRVRACYDKNDVPCGPVASIGVYTERPANAPKLAYVPAQFATLLGRFSVDIANPISNVDFLRFTIQTASGVRAVDVRAGELASYPVEESSWTSVQACNLFGCSAMSAAIEIGQLEATAVCGPGEREIRGGTGCAPDLDRPRVRPDLPRGFGG